MAMMRPAPLARAAWMTLRPTPPTPITAQVSPRPRSVRFHTEPMPVSTPQPMRQATERSMSSSTFTHWLRLDDAVLGEERRSGEVPGRLAREGERLARVAHALAAVRGLDR